VTEPNANPQQNGGSQQPNQGGSVQTNGDSQSTYQRGRYVPLPGQGPDYVYKGGDPNRIRE
jgi:hypothetical protein